MKMNMNMKWIISVAVVLLLCATAYAHRVNVYAYAEAGQVYVEGYFVDGSRAKNSSVEVYRADTGEKLLEGTTDEQGQFSFKIPGPYPLKVLIKASMGHQNTYTIEKDEVMEALGMKADTETPEEASEGGRPTERPPESASLSIEDFEALLKKHLVPMRQELVKLRMAQERPSVKDIFGGLGYIMGLVGLYLYIKARQN